MTSSDKDTTSEKAGQYDDAALEAAAKAAEETNFKVAETAAVETVPAAVAVEASAPTVTVPAATAATSAVTAGTAGVGAAGVGATAAGGAAGVAERPRVGFFQVIRMIVVAIFFGILAMFVLQNLEMVTVNFAQWSLNMPLAALIGGVGIAGNLIGSLLMFGRRRKK